MRLTKTFLTAVLATSTAYAAPAPALASKSMMATGEWTLNGFTRTCNADDTSCTYHFGINKNDGTLAPVCEYAVSGAPASRAPANGVVCGNFTVSSSWSGQFGDGKGFTTLAVIEGSQIIYPAFTDVQLVNGGVVSPDQSYVPQILP